MRACVICKQHNTIQPGTKSVMFEPGGATIVIKGVPALVCSNCGEAYFDLATTERALEISRAVAADGALVEVRAFRRAA